MLIVVLYLVSSIQILAEYERGVIFRLGKLLPQPKGPGVVLVFRPIDRIVRISLRTVVHDVPPQDIITRDNVSVKVNAVRVLPRHRSEQGGGRSRELRLRHVAAGADDSRSVLGQAELDDLLAERDRLNQELQQILDHQTDPWGIKVSSVEVKHVDLPENMQRAMGAPGRGRAREAREDHSRRRRADRVGQAGAGGGDHRPRAVGDHAALSADADGDRGGEEHDGRVPASDGTPTDDHARQRWRRTTSEGLRGMTRRVPVQERRWRNRALAYQPRLTRRTMRASNTWPRRNSGNCDNTCKRRADRSKIRRVIATPTPGREQPSGTASVRLSR